MSRLQAICFDYDGTIGSTNIRQFKWFQYWAEMNGKELTNPETGEILNELNQFMDFYNEKINEKKGLKGVQNVYDVLELPCDMNDKNHFVWKHYENFKNQNPSGFYEGMKETLLQLWEMGHLPKDPNLNRRIRMAINTTNTWASIRKELINEGVLHCFDSFVTEEVLAKYHGAGNPDSIKKPSPISLALTLGLIDSEAQFTIHVGDTVNDLAASHKVIRLNPNKPENLITIGAAYGYEGREKLQKGFETEDGTIKFNYIIDKPQELIPLIKTYI